MLFDIDNDNFNNYNVMDLSFFNIPVNKHYDFSGSDKDNILYDTKEGFLKGNMFKNLYDPYKHYSYALINPKTKKEEIELRLYELDFAINDINLYLDLHPEDMKMFNKFKAYINEQNQLKEKYIELVGPLCLTDVTSTSYNWLSNWPWEGDNK